MGWLRPTGARATAREGPWGAGPHFHPVSAQVNSAGGQRHGKPRGRPGPRPQDACPGRCPLRPSGLGPWPRWTAREPGALRGREGLRRAPRTRGSTGFPPRGTRAVGPAFPRARPAPQGHVCGPQLADRAARGQPTSPRARPRGARARRAPSRLWGSPGLQLQGEGNGALQAGVSRLPAPLRGRARSPGPRTLGGRG